MAINYNYGPALDEDGPTRRGENDILTQLRGYGFDVAYREPGPWTGRHMAAFFDELRDAFGFTFMWHETVAGVEVTIRGGASNEFGNAVHAVLRERLPAHCGLGVFQGEAHGDVSVLLGRPVPEPAPLATFRGIPVPTGKVNASGGDITYRFNGPRKPQQSTTAAPRPGQTWRSPTGEEGRIFDVTDFDRTFHLRMTSGLRVREEHADLVTAWTYVSGPTEPETPREAKDRVGALMVADRPEGVTERTWQAVVMAMGEGEDENGMRQKCAAARVALAVAERMRVLR